MSDDLWLVTPSGQRGDGAWIDDVLVERAAESGLEWRYSEAGNFPRERIESDPGHAHRPKSNAFIIGADGRMACPSSCRPKPASKPCCAAARVAPDKMLGEAEPLFGQATAEKAAANAVMAGCDAIHFPFVLAALESVLDPAFNLRGVQTTDENVAAAAAAIRTGPGAAPICIRRRRRARARVAGQYGRSGARSGSRCRTYRRRVARCHERWLGLGQPGRLWLVLAGEPSLHHPGRACREREGYAAEETLMLTLRAEAAVTVTGQHRRPWQRHALVALGFQQPAWRPLRRRHCAIRGEGVGG